MQGLSGRLGPSHVYSDTDTGLADETNQIRSFYHCTYKGQRGSSASSAGLFTCQMQTNDLYRRKVQCIIFTKYVQWNHSSQVLSFNPSGIFCFRKCFVLKRFIVDFKAILTLGPYGSSRTLALHEPFSSHYCDCYCYHNHLAFCLIYFVCMLYYVLVLLVYLVKRLFSST
jgi:hypothetical protein